MANAEIEFLPDRLNRQAAVWMGLTDGELKLAAVVNLGVFVTLGLVLGGLGGSVVLGMGGGTVAAGGGMWVSARLLRRLKRGKPDGYHEDRIRAVLEDRGLLKRTMLRESGVWDVRRHRT